MGTSSPMPRVSYRRQWPAANAGCYQNWSCHEYGIERGLAVLQALLSLPFDNPLDQCTRLRGYDASAAQAREPAGNHGAAYDQIPMTSGISSAMYSSATLDVIQKSQTPGRRCWWTRLTHTFRRRICWQGRLRYIADWVSRRLVPQH